MKKKSVAKVKTKFEKKYGKTKGDSYFFGAKAKGKPGGPCRKSK
jgi:hypothetical protein